MDKTLTPRNTLEAPKMISKTVKTLLQQLLYIIQTLRIGLWVEKPSLILASVSWNG